jgi:Ni,Fe-hydrogenase III large subunit
MSIGPVFSGEAESVHFQLETTGEEIFRVFPRLFFKYRGVEKMAEGRTVNDVLLLAERFAGTTAFSHALAYCMAVEQICKAEVPERAKILRLFLAELERLRHHIGVIESICNSTGLAVAASQTAALEEKALRLTAKLTGHRYLFGMAVPGGLSRDLDNGSLLSVIKDTNVIVRHLEDIYSLLINTSSFLDRIEEVGIVTGHQARNHGLVGPVARGSGCSNDIRKLQPYCAYDKFEFVAPEEQEGDGYARLRIFFTEAKQSAHIMEQAGGALVGGPVFSPCNIVPGVAAAGVEAPRGASWHWVSIGEDGKLKRYRLITPSFTNWHGFHLAVENYTFQDFPIILATFGLSVAESDR